MANRLNYNDLLKYMEIVLDMEKNVYIEAINEQISNAFVRLHKPFRQKSTILMVDFCHLP